MISKPRQKQHFESPTAYIGKLPTTGSGIGVVVMDEGFDVNHPDLKDRVTTVPLEPTDTFDSDPVGHGTLVSGIIAGNGASSGGQIRGVAPDAKVFAMKVNLDPKAGWKASSDSVAKGIEWAVQHREEHNIRVINCSFVLPLVEGLDPDTKEFIQWIDPLGASLKMAHEAGISVVAGTGNFADKQPIMTPAGNKNVIAVGALDTQGTPEYLDDDTVAHFSSRGKSTQGEDKPDILAPGVNIMSTNAPGSSFERKNAINTKFATVALRGAMSSVKLIAKKQIERGWLSPTTLQLPDEDIRHEVLRCYEVKASAGLNGDHPAYIAQNGTSEAAPIVAGVIANMLEANSDLGPDEVKEILFQTARPVQGDASAQGHGAINAQEAVRLAQESANSHSPSSSQAKI